MPTMILNDVIGKESWTPFSAGVDDLPAGRAIALDVIYDISHDMAFESNSMSLPKSKLETPKYVETSKSLQDPQGSHRFMYGGLRGYINALLRTNNGARDICHKAGRGKIFLRRPLGTDNEVYTYVLTTPWKIHYPAQLRNKLKKGLRDH
jgi:hypothetical protein